MHKTGTTSFQKFLSRNNNILRNFNCLYPYSMRYDSQHSLLPACFLGEHLFLPKRRILDPDFYINDLKTELAEKSYKLCIISSEVFHELMVKDRSKCFNILLKLTSILDSYDKN